jgi:hypothetical protein
MQGLKLRKYFRGQVGPHQINFGSPHNLLGQFCCQEMARIQDFTPFIPGLPGAFSEPPHRRAPFKRGVMKLRKYFRGQVGLHQINFGSPHNLLGAHQARIARLTPRLQVTLRWGGPLKAPGSPGINGVKSCILAISWQQNWPFYFRDYEKSKRSRQFLKEWKQNRPWLVDTESETGMVC